MNQSLRELALEKHLYELLQADRNKLWTVTSLQEAIKAPRHKIELAIVALEVQEKVLADRGAGYSWTIRLPRADHDLVAPMSAPNAPSETIRPILDRQPRRTGSSRT